MTDEQKRAYIKALLMERAGYVQYGRTDRVKDVDEELRRMGHDTKPPAKRATKMTRPAGTEL